jgi:hypothetical protein
MNFTKKDIQSVVNTMVVQKIKISAILHALSRSHLWGRLFLCVFTAKGTEVRKV